LQNTNPMMAVPLFVMMLLIWKRTLLKKDEL
jgi:hypothetical protein